MTSIVPVDKPPNILEAQVAEQASLYHLLPKQLLWDIVAEYLIFSDVVKNHGRHEHSKRGLLFNGVSYNFRNYKSFENFEYFFDSVPNSIVYARKLALLIFNNERGFEHIIKRSLNFPIVSFFTVHSNDKWPNIRLIDYIFCVVKSKGFRPDFDRLGKALKSYYAICDLGFDADKALVNAFNQKGSLTKEDIDKFLASPPTEDDSEKSKDSSQLGLLPSSQT